MKKTIAICVFLLLLAGLLPAQQIIFSGTVINQSTNLPVGFASIEEKGGAAVSADARGSFTIVMSKQPAVIVITATGFDSSLVNTGAVKAPFVIRLKPKTILLKSNDALNEVITDMRNICFNLMPKTLEEFGLVKAVKEFCHHSLYHKKLHFIIQQNVTLPFFSPELTIDLYRVIQEFITNSIRHGHASEIKIYFRYNKKLLSVTLSDNGKGFDPKQPGKGMGLQNVQSRVKSHNGKLDFESSMDSGTSCKIIIPLNEQQ